MSEKQRKERQARYSLYSTDSEDQVRPGTKDSRSQLRAYGSEYVLPCMPEAYIDTCSIYARNKLKTKLKPEAPTFISCGPLVGCAYAQLD